MMGFVLATGLYFIISGLAWIESAHGMGREDSQALVDLTDGKTLAEVNEIMQEGHKRIEERAFVANGSGIDFNTHSRGNRAAFTRVGKVFSDCRARRCGKRAHKLTEF
jgi:hypothetical protein